jgi:heterodisulfide reductase subunit B
MKGKEKKNRFFLSFYRTNKTYSFSPLIRTFTNLTQLRLSFFIFVAPSANQKINRIRAIEDLNLIAIWKSVQKNLWNTSFGCCKLKPVYVIAY